MLQIHDIIENFPATESKTLNFVKSGLYIEWPSFDFGDFAKTIPDQKTLYSLIDYAHELASVDMFKLAYESVYFSWQLNGEIFGAFVACGKDGESETDIIIITVYICLKSPFRICAIGTVVVYDFGKGPESSSESIQTKSTIIYQRPLIKLMSGAEEMLSDIAFQVIALATLLESPHTKTRVHQVGDKLNNKREKRGIPKIMPFHTVYFEVDGKEYNTDGSGIGSGSQKRLHWRRGHVRHLSSGKITHVRPCLVGALGTEAHVAKPMYSMKQKGSAA